MKRWYSIIVFLSIVSVLAMHLAGLSSPPIAVADDGGDDRRRGKIPIRPGI
ncbi:MAG: hypothetical protein MJE77_26800 [Proteobacteria bacterium]|nr:hypothetical protein [Pseudomonadota bacterium]